MTLAARPDCADESPPSHGMRRFFQRLSQLLPAKADPRLSRAEEDALLNPETRDDFLRQSRRRQWNPPAWWDHL